MGDAMISKSIITVVTDFCCPGRVMISLLLIVAAVTGLFVQEGNDLIGYRHCSHRLLLVRGRAVIS